jgi:hypothetical protein
MSSYSLKDSATVFRENRIGFLLSVEVNETEKENWEVKCILK